MVPTFRSFMLAASLSSVATASSGSEMNENSSGILMYAVSSIRVAAFSPFHNSRTVNLFFPRDRLLIFLERLSRLKRSARRFLLTTRTGVNLAMARNPFSQPEVLASASRFADWLALVATFIAHGSGERGRILANPPPTQDKSPERRCRQKRF